MAINNILLLPNYIFREDSSILFDSNTGVQYHLNEIACIVVSKLKTGKTIEQTATFISELCGIDKDIVYSDIIELLDQFKNSIAKKESFEFEKIIEHAPSFPFAIELELTRLCNWHCTFCYNVWKIDENNKTLKNKNKFLDKYIIFDILEEGKKNGLLRIRYSGGEPTLHPDFNEIIEYAAQLGIYQILFTNGRSINDITISHWLNNNIREVLISLHGDRESHDLLTGKKGTYDDLISKIKLLIDHKFEVVIEMVLTKKNYTNIITDIENIYNKLGVKEFRLMRYVPSGKLEDNILEIKQEFISDLIVQIEDRHINDRITIRFPCSPRFCLSESMSALSKNQVETRKKYLVQHCNAGKNWVSISYDNKLRICPHSNMYLANLSEVNVNLKNAWRDNVLPKVQSLLNNPQKICRDCAAWNDCKGGCYLSNFFLS